MVGKGVLWVTVTLLTCPEQTALDKERAFSSFHLSILAFCMVFGMQLCWHFRGEATLCCWGCWEGEEELGADLLALPELVFSALDLFASVSSTPSLQRCTSVPSCFAAFLTVKAS